MVRRVSVLALAAGLLTAAAGCRQCGGGGGWFTSSSRGNAPCQLVGRSNESCFDSAVGMPGPGGQFGQPGVPLLPAPAGEALPFPAPGGGDLIPRTAVPGMPVPSAQPFPAPADGSMGVLPAPKFGVPVKDSK